ncbi:MAG: hypothetical protein RMJ34_07375 [candidate division WOR-3 bacterium]|nr:hypothetical protein [candidate division WOR-3 bacterium]
MRRYTAIVTTFTEEKFPLTISIPLETQTRSEAILEAYEKFRKSYEDCSLEDFERMLMIIEHSYCSICENYIDLYTASQNNCFLLGKHYEFCERCAYTIKNAIEKLKNS